MMSMRKASGRRLSAAVAAVVSGALIVGTASADARVLVTGSSLSGDARVEIAAVKDNGDVVAWFNARGFTPMPFGAAVTIATGFRSANTKFADLDGDGKTEIMAVEPDTGNIRAWHNVKGFAPMPWGGDNVIVGTGFHDATRVQFADLNGDRRAEIFSFEADGDVRAWLNVRGFAPMPWGDSVIVATGFTPERTAFVHLDADGKAEILASEPGTGNTRAWHNIGGFAAMPYGESVTIAGVLVGSGRGIEHGDLDGDGRADLIRVDPETLQVHASRNEGGFSSTPWASTSIVIATGFFSSSTHFI